MIDAQRTAPSARARLPGWGPDVLAAVLAAGVLLAVSACMHALPGRPLDALGYALLVAAGVSMGLCRHWPQVAVGLVTVVLVVWAFRAYPRGHAVRRASVITTGLMMGEALIGAGLVLFRLVAHDESMQRALGVCLHLCNTFLLLGSTALTAWWASGGARGALRGQRAVAWTMGVPLAAMFLVGISGTVTALGDTLFPPTSLAAGFAQDFAPGMSLFVRLRAVHPVLAVSTGAAIVVAGGLVRAFRPSRAVSVFSRAAALLVLAQVAAGLLDVALLAPVWLQLVHLVLADCVWIALVLTTASALGVAPQPVSESAGAATRNTLRQSG